MYLWDGDLNNFIVNDCIVINGILVKCFKSTGDVTVPEGTEEIQRDDDIILNEESIETCNGFEQSTNINSLSLPESLKIIGPHTFCKMSQLTKLEYSGSIKHWIKTVEGKPYLLVNCPALKFIECADGIWTVPKLCIEKRLVAFTNNPKVSEVFEAEDLSAEW